MVSVVSDIILMLLLLKLLLNSLAATNEDTQYSSLGFLVMVKYKYIKLRKKGFINSTILCTFLPGARL